MLAATTDGKGFSEDRSRTTWLWKQLIRKEKKRLTRRGERVGKSCPEQLCSASLYSERIWQDTGNYGTSGQVISTQQEIQPTGSMPQSIPDWLTVFKVFVFRPF